MANLVLKFANFRYHDNRGRSEQSLNDTSKLVDPQNLYSGKCLGYISYAVWVIANFMLKSANFRCHGNKGRSEHSLTLTTKSVDPQNPLLGASIWAIFLRQLSYG